MGAGGETWLSGPTSTMSGWHASPHKVLPHRTGGLLPLSPGAIPQRSGQSPHMVLCFSETAWGHACPLLGAMITAPTTTSTSWRPLAASHLSIQSSSHRLDLSVLEYSFPRFLTSWSLLCWSQYSVFWGGKKCCVEREINSWWVLTTALVRFQLIPTASEAQGGKVTLLVWVVFHGNDRNLT